ncbi:hypothetical protein [Ligilactobacillus ruminis]|uniref:hypothetical protein n=1 Tax=Ligilactobacillus ruminis TaxID=1623 RepID=UPI0022DF9A3D|nr:hypothetical protein [Ligilactobacillus ruminis]
MEIGKEKAVMVPASTMGLLLAMASSADWETENTARIAANIVGLIGEPTTEHELNAYALAFSALEMQARGEDAKEIIDDAQEKLGDEMLEKVLKKIEEIESARRKKNE